MKYSAIKREVGTVFLVAVVVFCLNACGGIRKISEGIDSDVMEDEDPSLDDSTDESDWVTDSTEDTAAGSTDTTTATVRAKSAATTHHISTPSELGKSADQANLKLNNKDDDGSDKNTYFTVVTRTITSTTTVATTTTSAKATAATSAVSGVQNTTTTTTLQTTATTVDPQYHYLPVNSIRQNPELPTGCEVTSLTIALNYLGYNIDKCYMVDNYLPWTTKWYSINTHFIGNPRSPHGCGCNAPVIVDTANHYLSDNGDKYEAINKTGSSPSQLYDLVKDGYPVMAWATIGMQDTWISGQWKASDTGEFITFMKREHCLVLTGYDKIGGTVTFCDPMLGIASYSMSMFETRYSQLGNQAVILAKK